MLEPGISAVIPVFNSEESLPELVRRLRAVLDSRGRYEVVLVNDGSRDGSWERIVELSAAFEEVRGIDLRRNYGQHNALLAGIRAARFDTIVTLDDDLQHPPEELPTLLEHLEKGHEVVYGAPRAQQHGILRNVATRVTKFVLRRSLGKDTVQDISAFRAFRTTVRNAFDRYEGPFVSIDVLLSWGASRFSSVHVRHEPRMIGRSNYRVGLLARHTMNVLTGFTTVPLQLVSVIGFVFALFGVGVLVYVIGRFFVQGRQVPGFAFLASIIAVFAGAQLFALGMIGEYLTRMHFRTMGRPSYAVREEIGGQGSG